MNPKRWPAILSMPLIVLLLVASVGPQPARAQEGEAGVGPQAVLVSQTTGLGNGAVSTNAPNYSGGARAALAADDIIINTPNTTTYWIIQTITAYGENNGAPAISSVNVYAYADAGGVPGGNPIAAQSVSNFSGAPDFVIPVTLALQGAPGGRKYWIAVQANITSGTASWAWRSSSNGSGGNSESAWIDVFGNINLGLCSGIWGPRVTVCNIGAESNMAFQLDGVQVNLPNVIYLPLIRR